MSKKVKTIIVLVAVALFLTIPYSIHNGFKSLASLQLQNAFQSGIQTAISQLQSASANCAIFPVVMNGKTINLIDASCQAPSNSFSAPLPGEEKK